MKIRNLVLNMILRKIGFLYTNNLDQIILNNSVSRKLHIQQGKFKSTDQNENRDISSTVEKKAIS